jgi:hypothetical protein
MKELGPPHGASYAVVFRETGGPSIAGALVIDEDRLRLAGRAGDDRLEMDVRFTELAAIRTSRSGAERLNGRPVLVLERSQAPALYLAPLGAGLLGEITDLLSALQAAHHKPNMHVTVIVPLRKGTLKHAKELVAQGPPFDPTALGLTAHDVYACEHHLTFLFAGPEVRAQVERAARSPLLWRSGLAWRDCIAGRPRIQATKPDGGELLYSWRAKTTPPSPARTPPDPA